MRRTTLDRTLDGLRRRAAVAVLVGLLTVGRHETSALSIRTPPAVVRVRSVDPATEAWRALFPTWPAPN
jgi:hypothetical protein